jgi:hypothetical protein
MSRLLSLLLLTLGAHGLAPECLDPWRGWVAFKEFARATKDAPDAGVSVQVTGVTEDGHARLVLLRQEMVDIDGALTPVGGVVCEFTFAPIRHRARSVDHWSFDYSTFDRFVDAVEQEPVFQDLVVTRPLRSAVFWEEA